MAPVRPIDAAAVVDSGVRSFIDSYRSAFERLDVPAIAAHFAYPLHVAGDGPEPSVTAFADAGEWLPVLEGLTRTYRSIGVRAARPLDLTTVETSPRLVAVRVRWRLFGAGEAQLYDFTATYTLVSAGDGYRICAIAHDEAVQSRAARVSQTSRSENSR